MIMQVDVAGRVEMKKIEKLGHTHTITEEFIL